MSDFYGTYVGNNKIMLKLQAGGKMIAYADDLSITPALLYDGYLEIGLTNFMHQYLKPNMTVIDIGANIGYFSVVAGTIVGQSGKVFSFEANPRNYELMVDNLTINELKRNVVHFNKAVFSENTKLQFNVSERFQGNSSLKGHSSQYKDDFKSDTYKQIEVDAIALDAIELPQTIDLVKIDVEGAEYHVFKGMKELIESGRVKVIVFELNKSMLQEDVDAFKDLLLSYSNASIYMLASNGNLIATTVEEVFKMDYVDNIVLTF